MEVRDKLLDMKISIMNMLISNMRKNRHMSEYFMTMMKLEMKRLGKTSLRQRFKPATLHSIWQAKLLGFVFLASWHPGAVAEW